MKKYLTKIKTRIASTKEQGNIPVMVLLVALIGFIVPVIVAATAATWKAEKRVEQNSLLTGYMNECSNSTEIFIINEYTTTGNIPEELPLCEYGIGLTEELIGDELVETAEVYTAVQPELTEINDDEITITLQGRLGGVSQIKKSSFAYGTYIPTGSVITGFKENGNPIFSVPVYEGPATVAIHSGDWPLASNEYATYVWPENINEEEE